MGRNDVCFELSPFDQVGPRLYVHKLFCFPFPDPTHELAAIQHLRKALLHTAKLWPFIAGRVSPAAIGGPALAECLYTEHAQANNIAGAMNVKKLSPKVFPWTYTKLRQAGCPPSAFKIDVLSTVPEWPSSTETWPAFAVQANFIEGGLLLCFAFHHTVADGGSFTAFIKEFASDGRSRARVDSVIELDLHTKRRLPYSCGLSKSVRALQSFPEYDSSRVPLRPQSIGPITTRILTFPAETVRKLETAVNAQIKITHGCTAWASNVACLSSLIWVAVVRARRLRLSTMDIAKIGVAVNFRPVISPKLSDDYFGNAVVHTNAAARVFELVVDSMAAKIRDVRSSISISAVALAAHRMRQAVSTVNHTYVTERLQTFAALSYPQEVSEAYARALDTSHTGIDFSSWRDQGADLDFNIPGTATSKVDYWRKAWSPNEGAYNILPRKGGSKGEADWEVSLGLSVVDMERVCAGDELGGWFSRWVE